MISGGGGGGGGCAGAEADAALTTTNGEEDAVVPAGLGAEIGVFNARPDEGLNTNAGLTGTCSVAAAKGCRSGVVAGSGAEVRNEELFTTGAVAVYEDAGLVESAGWFVGMGGGGTCGFVAVRTGGAA